MRALIDKKLDFKRQDLDFDQPEMGFPDFLSFSTQKRVLKPFPPNG